MKNLLILVTIVLTIVLFGCSDKQPSDGQGYVFEINEGRVLILDDVKESDFGKSWRDIAEGYTGSAIWLSTPSSEYKIGQKVRYWVDGGIDDSLPAQARAKKIEIINEKE